MSTALGTGRIGETVNLVGGAAAGALGCEGAGSNSFKYPMVCFLEMFALHVLIPFGNHRTDFKLHKPVGSRRVHTAHRLGPMAASPIVFLMFDPSSTSRPSEALYEPAVTSQVRRSVL